MSKDADRSKVLNTIKVMKAVKNDGSWIHKANPGKKEQDKARTDVAEDNSCSPVKNKSYVLSAVKKFESADPPLNHALQSKEHPDTTVEEANVDHTPIPFPVYKSHPLSAAKATVKSEVGTTEDTNNISPLALKDVEDEDESVAPTEEVSKTRPETSAGTRVPGGYANASQSNGEHNKRAPEGYVDIYLEGQVQNGDAESVSQSKGNPEEYPDTTVEGSNGDHTTAKVSTIPDLMVSTGLFHTVPEDVVVKSLPETPAANKATPGNEKVLQDAAEPVPDGSAVETTEDTENISLLVLSSETSVGTRAHAEELGEVQPGIEQQATPGDEEVLQGAVESIHVSVPATVKSEESAVETTEDTKNISPPVLNAIMKFKDVDESAAPTEEVSKTGFEEAAECEVQLVNDSIAEESAESVPTNAEDLERELNINDALQPVNDLEAKAVQGKYSDRGIKLTDALDVQPPTADAVPEPVEDPEQSDDAHITEMSQKPSELLRRLTRDVKAVCSFCDHIIDGNTKLTLSEPAVTCHPECLKCSVCAKTLGDLLTRMFLHRQVIHCDDCFASALVA